MARVTRREALRTFAAAAVAPALATTATAATKNTGATPAPAGEMVSLQELRLYVAQTEAPTKAGVLLLPRINGLEDLMKNLAGDFPKAGMTGVVWDPYNGQTVNGLADSLARSQALMDEMVLRDLKRCVDYMQSELKLESIGIVGWCLGGRYVFIHAGNDARVKAATAYFPSIYSTQVHVMGPGQTIKRGDFKGQTMDEFAEAAKVTCPVQLVRAGKDNLCQPPEYERLESSLYSRPLPTILSYFPEADHGFTYNTGAVNAANTQISWPLTITFFKACLGA